MYAQTWILCSGVFLRPGCQKDSDDIHVRLIKCQAYEQEVLAHSMKCLVKGQNQLSSDQQAYILRIGYQFCGSARCKESAAITPCI